MALCCCFRRGTVNLPDFGAASKHSASVRLVNRGRGSQTEYIDGKSALCPHEVLEDVTLCYSRDMIDVAPLRLGHGQVFKPQCVKREPAVPELDQDEQVWLLFDSFTSLDAPVEELWVPMYSQADKDGDRHPVVRPVESKPSAGARNRRVPDQNPWEAPRPDRVASRLRSLGSELKDSRQVSEDDNGKVPDEPPLEDQVAALYPSVKELKGFIAKETQMRAKPPAKIEGFVDVYDRKRREWEPRYMILCTLTVPDDRGILVCALNQRRARQAARELVFGVEKRDAVFYSNIESVEKASNAKHKTQFKLRAKRSDLSRNKMFVLRVSPPRKQSRWSKRRRTEDRQDDTQLSIQRDHWVDNIRAAKRYYQSIGGYF